MSPVILAAHPMETPSLPQTVPAVHFGVGAILSASNMGKLAVKLSGKDVFYVGSCGSFSGHEILSLVCPRQVSWSDMGQRLDQSYAIEGDLRPISLNPYSPIAASLPNVDAVSSATISLSNKHSFVQDTVENVELYSVASALHERVASFTAVLIVTNAVGQNAHSQWKHNVTQASQTCMEYLRSKLWG